MLHAERIVADSKRMSGVSTHHERSWKSRGIPPIGHGIFQQKDSHTLWKVMEFNKGILRAWKVMDDCGHGKSWNSTNRSWNFLTEG